jgi:hypothetical protein
MGTRDLTLGGDTLVSDQDKPKFVLLQRTRDFSVAANTVTAGDVLQVLNVPAGFLCMGVLVETQTKEWTTSTPCQVGDGDDTDGWLTTAMCLLNTVTTAFCSSTSAYGAALQGRGKFYPVADTIDVIPKIDLGTAKIRVGAWGFMADPGNDTAF